MIEDLHAHTRYSLCGRDEPYRVVERAISGGVDILGITDHNYGIGARKAEYLNEMGELKRAYNGRIRILRGIEIATLPGKALLPGDDVSAFDFCLIEHIDYAESLVGARIGEYAKELGIPTGIAHTDLFAFAASIMREPAEFMRSLSEAGVFWELNVNYDSIHAYREHAYVAKFISSPEQRRAAREAGICLSVGFDGHREEDYLPERVKAMNNFLADEGLKRAFIDA